MDIKLRERLDILEGAGQIDKNTVGAIDDFVKILEDRFAIEITDENGSMLVTHLAMALSRIQAGEEITPLDDFLLDELRASPAYKEIPSLIEELEKQVDLEIPKAEYGYIGLHLANLVYNRDSNI